MRAWNGSITKQGQQENQAEPEAEIKLGLQSSLVANVATEEMGRFGGIEREKQVRLKCVKQKLNVRLVCSMPFLTRKLYKRDSNFG